MSAHERVHMGTKTIRLDEEAYDRLESRKREGESFSDVVKRLAGERSLKEVAGIWADDVDDVRAAIEEQRAEREDELDRIAERLE